MQPSEIERMPYWEYELVLKAMNDRVTEENKQQEDANGGFDGSSYMKKAESMMKTPKMPSMPSMPRI